VKPISQLSQIRFILNNGEIIKVADKAADLDVVGLADDDWMAAFFHESGEGLMDAGHQGTGGVVNVVAQLPELMLDAIRGAVSGQEHGGRSDLVGLADPRGPGGIEASHHVRVVNEVAKDGDWPLASQAQGQVNGIADAKTGAQMFRHVNLHRRLLLSAGGPCPFR
jgi:hypothetical protein